MDRHADFTLYGTNSIGSSMLLRNDRIVQQKMGFFINATANCKRLHLDHTHQTSSKKTIVRMACVCVCVRSLCLLPSTYSPLI
jgi:hypothetical protein